MTLDNVVHMSDAHGHGDKKKKAGGDSHGGHGAAEEKSKWGALELEQVEKLLHPDAIAAYRKQLTTTLEDVYQKHKDHLKSAKHADKVADAIVEALAEHLLPPGLKYDERNAADVKQFLSMKGVSGESIRQRLASKSYESATDFVGEHAQQLLKAGGEYIQQLASRALSHYHSTERGKLVKHIEGRTGASLTDPNTISLDDVYRVMSSYMAMDGALDAKGKVQAEKTRLGIDQIVELGPVLKQYESAKTEIDGRREEVSPLTYAKPKKQVHDAAHGGHSDAHQYKKAA